ncbi:hypothetical protein H5P28_00225 [Ruficoccus amylovorans]|uniref:Uncharacterized protein n=1 Tax=Ruficoccus amylovorans TaxID=1804625 RepID=A0A842HAL4_9BACT|nr:hypothetical protein [Ruficoccus amylovorans]MBC2592677.1 hypothetical protein [Ruficoccus amylovorans]
MKEAQTDNAIAESGTAALQADAPLRQLRETARFTAQQHVVSPLTLAREAAQRWRDRQSEYTPPHATDYTTGWVIVHHGAGAGWTRSLDHRPCAWVPGCLAVPADGGPVYIAVGGNDQDGAQRWEILP